MNARQLNDSLSECLNQIRIKHQEKGYKRFIYDGVVNAEIYTSSPVKVCFLLKECYVSVTASQNDIRDHKEWLKTGSYPRDHHWVKYISNPNDKNDDCTYSLVENLRNEAPWAKMWNAVKHMTDVILSAADNNVPHSSTLKNIAVVNLKKSNGISTSTDEDIISYAKDDREYLLEELTLLAPDIIVCGGTFALCKAASLFTGDLHRICTFAHRSGLRAAWRWGDTVILDAWHPSAPALGYDRFSAAYLQHADLLRKESGIS